MEEEKTGSIMFSAIYHSLTFFTNEKTVNLIFFDDNNDSTIIVPAAVNPCPDVKRVAFNIIFGKARRRYPLCHFTEKTILVDADLG